MTKNLDPKETVTQLRLEALAFEMAQLRATFVPEIERQARKQPRRTLNTLDLLKQQELRLAAELAANPSEKLLVFQVMQTQLAQLQLAAIILPIIAEVCDLVLPDTTQVQEFTNVEKVSVGCKKSELDATVRAGVGNDLNILEERNAKDLHILRLQMEVWQVNDLIDFRNRLDKESRAIARECLENPSREKMEETLIAIAATCMISQETLRLMKERG